MSEALAPEYTVAWVICQISTMGIGLRPCLDSEHMWTWSTRTWQLSHVFCRAGVGVVLTAQQKCSQIRWKRDRWTPATRSRLLWNRREPWPQAPNQWRSSISAPVVWCLVSWSVTCRHYFLTVDTGPKTYLGSSDGLATRVRVRDIPEHLAHAHVPTTIVPKGACFERKSFVSGTAVRGRFIELKQPWLERSALIGSHACVHAESLSSRLGLNRGSVTKCLFTLLME